MAKALRLRGVRPVTWGGLYRLFEVIEGDVGGLSKMVEAGWTSKAKLKAFKHTANSPSVTGDEARHGKEMTQPPNDPMDLDDAQALVDDLLMQWIRSKDPDAV